MADKKLLVLGYVLLGLILALWPVFAAAPRVSGDPPRDSPRRQALALGLAVLALSVAAPLFAVVAAVVIALAMAFKSRQSRLESMPSALAMAAGVLAIGLVPWWLRSGRALDIEAGEFAGLLVLGTASYGLLRLSRPAGRTAGTLAAAAFLVLAFALSFSTGILQQPNAVRDAWHHWGAYIGPTEIVMAGATIFRDVPVQYGPGPTWLLAAACGTNCWSGMYWLAAIGVFAHAVCIFALAWAVGPRTLGGRIFTAAACAATCFLWNAYPPGLATPVATPSTNGLRFLPATLLAVYLVYAGRHGFTRRVQAGAFALWSLALLWAPESAFYASFVWWPFYVFLHRKGDSFLPRVRAVLWQGSQLVAAALALLALVAGGFALVHGAPPRLVDVIAYALYPPGVMPVNWNGTIGYFLTCVLAGTWALARQWRAGGDTHAFRSGLVVHLLCYSSASYFLGRSHDNNLLNIVPFVVPVLMHALAVAQGAAWRIVALAAAALIAWLPAFNWTSWRTSLQEGSLLSFDPAGVRQKMTSRPAALPLAYLEKHSPDPVTVIDPYLIIVPASPDRAWNAMHSPANFVYVPSEYRQRYLKDVAHALGRPGWLLIGKGMEARWVEDFQSAYTPTEILDFENYRAFHLVPRKD